LQNKNVKDENQYYNGGYQTLVLPKNGLYLPALLQA
jgi:hypothetical protein